MIELFTAATPNGWKVSIALEELALPYTVRVLSLSKLEQKEEWFLKINPNGRIPAIIDHDNGDFPLFESGAILIYLAEKTGKLLPNEPKARSRVLQWLMFQMSGIGPMMGQAGGEYSIADIALWSWIAGYGWSGVSVDGLPALARWMDLIGARPAVQKGRAVPPPLDTTGEKAKDTVESARKMLA